ncbi:MAG: hypothetical protein JXP34_20020 [Planctomycetes bacterium]|nr:hypothetical protein [Planctomycetota bacterium]
MNSSETRSETRSERDDRSPRRGPGVFLAVAFAIAIASGIPGGVTHALRPWTQFVRHAAFGELGDKAIEGRRGWLFYRPAVEYAIEPWSIDRNDAPGHVVSAIVSFRDQLAERGIRLLVMIAPNKASVYPDRLANRAAAGPEARAHAVPAATLDVLNRVREAGVEVLDLFEIFREARRARDADPSGALYLAQDSHWSPEGVRLAARAAAARLASLGWIERRPSPFAIEPAPIARPGDVLRMVQAPPIERAFGTERIACAKIVETETRAPYRDDPGSPVLVIGDSFLRIYADDDPGSAGFVAHLAHEIGFAVASIVNDGGGSTLVRQQLARRRALLEGRTAIVWEFVERDIRYGMEGWQAVPLPLEPAHKLNGALPTKEL